MWVDVYGFRRGISEFSFYFFYCLRSSCFIFVVVIRFIYICMLNLVFKVGFLVFYFKGERNKCLSSVRNLRGMGIYFCIWGFCEERCIEGIWFLWFGVGIFRVGGRLVLFLSVSYMVSSFR